MFEAKEVKETSNASLRSSLSLDKHILSLEEKRRKTLNDFNRLENYLIQKNSLLEKNGSLYTIKKISAKLERSSDIMDTIDEKSTNPENLSRKLFSHLKEFSENLKQMEEAVCSYQSTLSSTESAKTQQDLVNMKEKMEEYKGAYKNEVILFQASHYFEEARKAIGKEYIDKYEKAAGQFYQRQKLYIQAWSDSSTPNSHTESLKKSLKEPLKEMSQIIKEIKGSNQFEILGNIYPKSLDSMKQRLHKMEQWLEKGIQSSDLHECIQDKFDKVRERFYQRQKLYIQAWSDSSTPNSHTESLKKSLKEPLKEMSQIMKEIKGSNQFEVLGDIYPKLLDSMKRRLHEMEQWLEKGIQSSDLHKYIQNTYFALSEQWNELEKCYIDEYEGKEQLGKQYQIGLENVLNTYRKYIKGYNPINDPIMDLKGDRFRRTFIDQVRRFQPTHIIIDKYNQALKEGYSILNQQWNELEKDYQVYYDLKSNSKLETYYKKFEQFTTAYKEFGKEFSIMDDVIAGPKFRRFEEVLQICQDRLSRYIDMNSDTLYDVASCHKQALKANSIENTYKILTADHEILATDRNQILRKSLQKTIKLQEKIKIKYSEIENSYNEHFNEEISDIPKEIRQNFRKNILECIKYISDLSSEFKNFSTYMDDKCKILKSAAKFYCMHDPARYRAIDRQLAKVESYLIKTRQVIDDTLEPFNTGSSQCVKDQNNPSTQLIKADWPRISSANIRRLYNEIDIKKYLLSSLSSFAIFNAEIV